MLDEGVDCSGERFVVGADGDDVMRVVGYGRGDGALLKFEIFDEGDGGFGVVVPIDHGDFEDVLRGIGLEVAPDVPGFGDALTGDDLSVDGFDDIDSSAISWEEEVVG